MTIAPMNETSAIVAEFCGGSTPDVSLMIGIGLVKDSDAVYFQYLGEENAPVALTLPNSGKPLQNLYQVRLAGVSVAKEIGEFKATKLNLYLESNQGRIVMLTSGLQTIWSQCVLTGLMDLIIAQGMVDAEFSLSTWKGNSKMKPCFAAIRIGDAKYSDNSMYQALADARGDRDTPKVLAILEDAVECINNAVNGAPIKVVVEDNKVLPAEVSDLDF